MIQVVGLSPALERRVEMKILMVPFAFALAVMTFEIGPAFALPYEFCAKKASQMFASGDRQEFLRKDRFMKKCQAKRPPRS